ncbi:gluconolactonase [bacterium A37T11]|nr:gluconolactonase [bacterium A37T11]
MMRNWKFAVYALFILPFLSQAQQWDSTGIISSGAQLTVLGSGYSFTEGPAADRQGNVYFTDQPNNQIIRWDATSRATTVFLRDAGRANGMYVDKAGHLLACADLKNELWSIDTKTRKPTVLVTAFRGKLLNGPNDLWVTPNGNVYFSDPFYKRDYWLRDTAMQQDGQCLYYYNRDNKNIIRVDSNYIRPNGLVGTPDGKTLYVSDIGDSKIYRYRIHKDGQLRDRTLFARASTDGMTLDNRGNVYLAGNGITVFNPKGEKIAYIPVPAKWAGNVCFGGKNHDLLFITASTQVFGLAMNVRGAGY